MNIDQNESIFVYMWNCRLQLSKNIQKYNRKRKHSQYAIL